MKSIEPFARWISKITYSATERRWKVALITGNIIETRTLNGATERIARIIGADVAAMVAETLGINPEAITSPVRKREHVDARHVVANILRDNFEFTFRQIKNVICIKSNHAIIRALGNAEVFEVNEKMQKVYRAYPWIKNQNETPQ